MAETLETPVTHAIEPDDTLTGISLKYYGTTQLWVVIRDKNAPLDPKKLRPGDTLIIPGIPRLYWQRQAELIKSNRGNFQVYSPFQGSDEKFAAAPYLLPPISPGSQFTTELSLSVDNLFLETGEKVQTVIENEDFRFAWSPSPATAARASRIDAQITIRANNVWKTGTGARREFRANFTNFCSQIENLELNGNLIPDGTAILTQRVAEILPGTFDETLFFHYGFNSGYGARSSPYVNLHPGMRLRLEYSPNQSVSNFQFNGTPDPRQFFYTIGRDRDQRITFDAFLGAISPPAFPFAPLMNTASGLLDLHAAGNARRHFRLFYPAQMKAIAAVADSTPGRNVTLIGADTLTDLQVATNAYIASGKIGTASAGNRPIIAFTLPGRAAVIPEIGVTIQYKTGTLTTQPFQYIPLGTTMRQVMDSLVPTWNPSVFFVGGIRPVVVSRLFSQVNGLPEYREVLFNMTPDFFVDHSIFDLPLVQGDHLEISLASAKTP